MNKVIKKFLNIICIFLTWCLNQGQKIIVWRESHSFWKIPNGLNPEDYREDYGRYKQNLKKFGFKPSKFDFFVFCKYFRDAGNDPSLIVPASLVHNYLTAIFNPIDYNNYFEDKNMMDKILPREFLPATVLRRIDGEWYDAYYNKISLEDWKKKGVISFPQGARVIVKPAKDSSSGRGIKIFEFDGNEWLNIQDNNEKLTLDNISQYWGEIDLTMQEVIKQSEFFNQFCDTSVNTLRTVIYNSPVDGGTHLIWCGLRIGSKGSIVDNNHAGGIIVGVGKDGKMGSYGTDQYGKKYTHFNGIDFKKGEFIIPQFNEIIDFAKNASLYLFPHRFIAFDITITNEGKPVFIEYNLRGYSGWLAQFSGNPMFGDKTEEILSYLSSHKKSLKKFFYKIN